MSNFWGAVQKTPSVQKKGVFMHRMPFSYHKSLFLVPSPQGKLPLQRSLANILVDLFLLVPVYDYRFGIGIELLFRFVERLQKRVSGALVSNGGGRTVSRIHLYRWVEKYDLFHY